MILRSYLQSGQSKHTDIMIACGGQEMQTRFPGVDLRSEFLKTTFDCTFSFIGCVRREKFRHKLFQILQRSYIVVLKISDIYFRYTLRTSFINFFTFIHDEFSAETKRQDADSRKSWTDFVSQIRRKITTISLP